MEQLWQRIEATLGRSSPETLRTLNPGASADSIDATEKALGVTFPADLRASFQIHDGQPFDAPAILGGVWRLLPLAGVLREWTIWKELLNSGEFKRARSAPANAHHLADWWNPAWIPLTTNGAGDHHCLDLAPGPTGRPGQIILMLHDSPERPVVGDNYRDWLTSIAEEWEIGQPSGVSDPRVVSMQDLLQLIGRSLKEEEVKSFLATQPLEKELDDDMGYLHNRPAGYQIEFKKKRIITVFIQTVPTSTLGSFTGPLVNDVTASDGHTAVRTRLGLPTRSRNFDPANPAPQGGWDCYDLPHVSIQFFYRNNQPGLERICLMSPDTAPGRAKTTR